MDHILANIEPLDVPLVSPPPHPFGLRRQVPIIRIQVPDQPGLDFALRPVCSIVRPLELRAVGCPAGPCVAAGVVASARRHPKDRCKPAGVRANEVPLRAPETARTRCKGDMLTAGLGGQKNAARVSRVNPPMPDELIQVDAPAAIQTCSHGRTAPAWQIDGGMIHLFKRRRSNRRR